MKTKSLLYVFAVLSILLAFTVAPVAAVIQKNENRADVKFLGLIEKTPVPEGAYPWVENGAWGKLMYKESQNPMFVFNGHGLDAGVEYSLISYNEDWGSLMGSVEIGTGVSDEYGNIYINGDWIDSNLICNTYPTDTSEEYSGEAVKIWLVLSDDINQEGKFISWNPTEYLFEEDVIPCMVHIQT